MKPTMAYVETHLCFPPHESEEAAIKQLKTQPFPTQVCYGADCIIECLKIMIRHAIDAVHRTFQVRKHYERHNLTPEEEILFQAATKCIYCQCIFDEKDPLVVQLTNDVCWPCSTLLKTNLASNRPMTFVGFCSILLRAD